MSNVPEELDKETAALIEKLGPAPQRDPRAAGAGKSKFLTEANAYRASVSAAHEQRHMGGKENAMRRLRIPNLVALMAVIGMIGLVVVAGLMITGPVIGNTFSTINSSLSSVNSEGGPRQQPPGQAAVPTYGLQIGNTHTPGQSMPNAQPTPGAAVPVVPSAGYRNQLVIKNGEMRLLVKDTDRALDGVTQIVGDVRGYIISSRTWSQQDYYGDSFKYATLTIGVPVDQFENAVRRLRSLAIRVLDDTASGQDVTDQYVDLESRVANLEATRDRIKSFLDQTTTVEEALQINQQLSEVEGQIEALKGQMNYLSNRAAFSTITINLEPELPKVVASPTPTATPTPVAALGPWDAGETAQQATDMLVSVYRLVADVLIWFFLVVVPVFGPPIVLTWVVTWLIRRRTRAAAKGQGA